MKLSFKPYKRKLKVPVKMSRGVITEREGIVLRLEGETVSFSEVLILNYFGTETLEQSLNILSALPQEVSFYSLELIPQEYFATRFAFESLFLNLNVNKKMPVSKLLPAGPEAIDVLEDSLAKGFRTFKWKIGINENEFDIFTELVAKAQGVNFRLDANAGLSFESASKWLKFLESKPVEFLEQPLAVEQFDSVLNLKNRYSTPIALDESVAKFEDIKKAYDLGWDGLYVVKPLRLGNIKEFLNWREKSKAKIVYSSALESIFGTVVGLKIAASDVINNYALGYGVSTFFEDDGLGLEETSNLITNLNETRLEEIWQKLSF